MDEVAFLLSMNLHFDDDDLCVGINLIFIWVGFYQKCDNINMSACYGIGRLLLVYDTENKTLPSLQMSNARYWLVCVRVFLSV